MKYAIIGPRGAINRISDTEPQYVSEQATVAQITDEQAAQVEAGRTSTPRVIYALVNGELMTLQQKLQLDRVASMTPSDFIKEGERHVESQGYSAARLVTCMDTLLQVKEANALPSHPKLTAVYAWLQTVKATALQGSVQFASAPHTFEEVMAEAAQTPQP